MKRDKCPIIICVCLFYVLFEYCLFSSMVLDAMKVKLK